VYKVLIKPEAENDLTKIFEYTFHNWGIDQAEKYQDELYNGIELIANQVKLGKEYHLKNLPYRYFHVNRHLIFYRIADKECIVIRILHDRMDIKKHLNDI